MEMIKDLQFQYPDKAFNSTVNAGKVSGGKTNGSIFVPNSGNLIDELLFNDIGLNTPDNNSICPDLNELDPFGIQEIIMLVSQLFKPRNYSPEQIKEMNSLGIYTSSSEMTPDMIKNITKGKVKDLKEGNYGKSTGRIDAAKNLLNTPIDSIKGIISGTYGGVKLSEAQVNNAKIIAATIVDVGKKQNKSPEEIRKAVVVALSTAMQESTLNNIGYGDINQKTGKMTSSVGLFQQISAWGSKEDRMDPVHATTMFAEKLYQTNYMNKSVTAAAQNVQKSAFPDAYAKWQNMAEDMASKLLA